MVKLSSFVGIVVPSSLASDVKLREIRRRVESGIVTKSRSFSSGETKFIRRNSCSF